MGSSSDVRSALREQRALALKRARPSALARLLAVLCAYYELLRVRHVLVAAAVLVVGTLELRLWRECEPGARALYERDRVIALGAQCDTRSPLYAIFREHLDCATPRSTLAKGPTLVALECVARKQPFAAYYELWEPLIFPQKERAVEWLMGAGATLGLVLLAALVVPQVTGMRREERLHRELHTVVRELGRTRQTAIATAHVQRIEAPPRTRVMPREARFEVLT